MSITLRTRAGVLRALGAFAFAALVAGCPTAVDEAPPEEGDGGSDAVVNTGPPCSRLTTVCGKGEKCEGAPDCASQLCREGKCNDVVPADGVKSGDARCVRPATPYY
jgi:hypothetical protein